MKLPHLVFSLCLPLITVAPLEVIAPSAVAAEDTLLFCQGNTRNTARIYRNDGSLMMRLFDRQDKVTWFNSPARSETNPEVIPYSNLRGEQPIQITSNRNDTSLCSIQVGNQPLERGSVTVGKLLD